MALGGGKRKPLTGLRSGLRHALAGLVHGAELKLCGCQTLVGGQLVPLQGFGVILGRAPALGAHAAQVVLGLGMAQRRSRAVMPQRFGKVCRQGLGYEAVMGMQHAQVVVGSAMALGGCEFIVLKGA